jgi:hypothetical protein
MRCVRLGGELGIPRISIVDALARLNDHRQEEAKRIRRDEGDLRVALVLLYSDTNGNAVTFSPA